MFKISKKNYLFVILLATALFFVNFLFYSKFGLFHERDANLVYIKLIQNFPESLDARTEPLFIAIAWGLKQITHFDVAIILIILKNIILAASIFTFYKIVKLITNNKAIVYLPITLLFAFSYTTIQISDNLLRNSLGNVFYFSFIYIFLIILGSYQVLSRTKRIIYLGVAGLLAGGLFYTHILPAIIVATSLFTYGLLSLVVYWISLIRHGKEDNYLASAKTTFSVLLVGLLVGFKYLQRMIAGRESTSDYQAALSVSSDQSTSFAAECQTLSNHSFFVKLKDLLVHVFRFLFEYRDTSLPLALAILTFVSIGYLLIKKWRDHKTLFLIISWLIVYFGTKADFFGIGVLSYRFTLMLLPLSLMVLSLFLVQLLRIVDNRKFTVIFISLFVCSFLGHNLPPILESTILISNASTKSEYTKWNNYFSQNADLIPANSKILDNGVNILLSRPDLVSIYDPAILTDKSSKSAFGKVNEAGIGYIIIDTANTTRAGNDIGSKLDYNLDIFFDQQYFTKIGEIDSPLSIDYIFKVNEHPEGPSSETNLQRIIINNDQDLQNLNRQLADSKIDNWQDFMVLSENVGLTEEIKIGAKTYQIDYAPEMLNNISQSVGLLSSQWQMNLPKLEARSKQDYVVDYAISSGEVILSSNQNIIAKNLTKPAYNQLRVAIENPTNPVQIKYLSRCQFQLVIRLIFVILFLCFAFIYIFVLDKKNKKIAWYGKLLIILILLELLFGSHIVELYKRIFNL